MKKLFFALTLLLLLTIGAMAVGALNINEVFDYAEFTHGTTTLPYRIYIPEDYSEDNEYPLVVFLHGAGERGADNELQLKNALQTLFDRDDALMAKSIVIAPQCPEGEQWVDTPWADGNYSTDEIPESDELAEVVELTSNISKEYSVDKSRVYAMGVSMGGFGTWDLIIRHNDIFAAAAPMCGGGDPTKAEMLIDTPIYTFHGTSDNSVPYEGTAEMVSAIEDTGSRLINFITYEGEGHGIWETASSEPYWLEWLFEQKLTDRYPQSDETDTATEPLKTNISTEADNIESDTQESNSDENTDTNVPNATEELKDEGDNFPVWIIVIIVAVVIAIGNMFSIILSKNKK